MIIQDELDFDGYGISAELDIRTLPGYGVSIEANWIPADTAMVYLVFSRLRAILVALIIIKAALTFRRFR